MSPSSTSRSPCRARNRSGPGWSRRTTNGGRGRGCSGCTGWASDTTTAASSWPLAVDARRARCRLAAAGGPLPVGPRPGRHRHRRPARGPRPGRGARGCARPPRGPARASTRTASPWSATTTAGCTASCSPNATSGSRRWHCRHRTPRWENWFASYWLKLDDDARKEYAALFADLEPVDAVARLAGRLGDRMLLQWAGNDTFVTAESRAAYERANPRARSVSYDNARPHARRPPPPSTSSRSSRSGWGLDQN